MSLRYTIQAFLGAASLFGCAVSLPPPQLAVAAAKAICSGGLATSDQALEPYAGCKRVVGNLTLNGMTHLDALQMLERVDGQLTVAGNLTASLTGLEHLSYAQSIVIDSNALLDDISALSHLSNVRRLGFSGNQTLASPKGIARLSSLDELTIKHSGFTSLAGLESLQSIRRVVISENSKLISVRALRYVTRIDELILERNGRICASLGFFGGLEQPPTRSVIQHNPTLFVGDIGRLLHSSKALRPN
jgi:hypothetical protein